MTPLAPDTRRGDARRTQIGWTMNWDDLYKDETFRLKEPNDEVIVFAHHLEKIGPPAPVLNIGFGTGRHAVFLAWRGYEVHGIDISERGKEYAERWLADEELTADLRIAT